MRGGFGRNVVEARGLAKPRAARRDRDCTRNTQRARAIARERKVIFHRRSWKTVPIVRMLKALWLESVLGNLRNGIISLS